MTRLFFADPTHQMKNYPNVLQNWNIDVAVKTTLISYVDIISNNLLSFFRRKLEFTKLHTNGTDFYANCRWWKKFQREEHCRNWLVMLNSSHYSLLKWLRRNKLCGVVHGRGSVLKYRPVWLYLHTCHEWLLLRLVSWSKAQYIVWLGITLSNWLYFLPPVVGDDPFYLGIWSSKEDYKVVLRCRQ